MSREIIINADDFGWTDGHNLAVELAHKNGVLHRASILCNGKAFDDAIKITRQLPNLQVGVHLSLNEGHPLVLHGQPHNLLRLDRSFYDNVTDLAWLWLNGMIVHEEVMAEWRAQIERFQSTGLVPSHLDSHKHIHVIPPLLNAIITLASEYNIDYIRLPLERLHINAVRRGSKAFWLWLFALNAKNRLLHNEMRFADDFIGISHSGKMNAKRLNSALANLKVGLTEIMVHPAKVTPSIEELRKKYRWASQYLFEDELSALLELDKDLYRKTDLT